MITGFPSSKTRRATKRSPEPMCARASTTRRTASVHVLERGVHRRLHALGECVQRTLEARHVDERELEVGAVRDAEQAATGRVRHVGRDRDLLARERVHERGLADVRTAGDCDDAALHR
jgi:hypothetical protein